MPHEWLNWGIPGIHDEWLEFIALWSSTIFVVKFKMGRCFEIGRQVEVTRWESGDRRCTVELSKFFSAAKRER
jgi:hypothetical protein